MTDYGDVSIVWYVEKQGFEGNMNVSYGLEFLRIPVRVLLSFILEIFAIFDIIIEVVKRMLKSILENGGVPIVRAPFITIYYVNKNFQLGFIGIIL